MRRELIQHLLSAWEQSISVDYNSQRINSERSLQASYWSQLNSLLPRSNRRIFIEPTFHITIGQDRKKVVPDLVICNRHEVIGIVELKYQPKMRPGHRKDIETLQHLSAARFDLQLKHSRHRGVSTEQNIYRFSKNMVFAWAGVHAPPSGPMGTSYPLFNEGAPALQGCYLQLHAVTHQDADPEIVVHRG